VPHVPWEPLRICADDDIVADLEDLPRDTKEAILHAIDLYARSGQGGTVALAPSGALPMEALHVEGLEIRFHIDPDNADGPTMVLSEVCLLESDATDD
jgi:hypothetical protein